MKSQYRNALLVFIATTGSLFAQAPPVYLHNAGTSGAGNLSSQSSSLLRQWTEPTPTYSSANSVPVPGQVRGQVAAVGFTGNPGAASGMMNGSNDSMLTRLPPIGPAPSFSPPAGGGYSSNAAANAAANLGSGVAQVQASTGSVYQPADSAALPSPTGPVDLGGRATFTPNSPYQSAQVTPSTPYLQSPYEQLPSNQSLQPQVSPVSPSNPSTPAGPYSMPQTVTSPATPASPFQFNSGQSLPAPSATNGYSAGAPSFGNPTGSAIPPAYSGVQPEYGAPLPLQGQMPSQGSNNGTGDLWNGFGLEGQGAGVTSGLRDYESSVDACGADCNSEPIADAACGSGGCAPGCQGLCDPCRPCWWFRAGVMLGWLNGYDTPAILTSNHKYTPKSMVGDLYDDSTKVLYGGNDFGDGLRVGGRVSAGIWCDPCRRWGFGVDAFSLGNDDDDKIDIYSKGDPILARPFYNTDPHVKGYDAQVLAMYDYAKGRFRADTSSRLVSVGPAFHYNLLCCNKTKACPPSNPCDPCGDSCDPCSSPPPVQRSCRLDMTLGYRYVQLKEGFNSREDLYAVNSLYVPGTSFSLFDDIDTRNDFHGFELGGLWQGQHGRWTWEVGGSAAFGKVRQRYTLNGSTTTYVPDGLVDYTVPGGFLVRPEDIGSYRRSKSTVVPQGRIGLGYCIGCNTRLHVDYSFLYMDDVIRPGSLMSTHFDGRTLGKKPGEGVVGSSNYNPKTDSVTMHGLTIGVSYNF